MTVRGG